MFVVKKCFHRFICHTCPIRAVKSGKMTRNVRESQGIQIELMDGIPVFSRMTEKEGTIREGHQRSGVFVVVVLDVLYALHTMLQGSNLLIFRFSETSKN